MVFKLYIVIIIFLNYEIFYAQVSIRGKVLDNETKEGIPYVNIGIPNTHIGTSSYEDGTFIISIPDNYLTSRLHFSSIQHDTTSIQLTSKYVDSLYVMMTSKVEILNEVVIIDKSYSKRRSEGLRGVGGGGIQLSSPEGGAAMGVLLNNNAKDIKLISASIFIHENELDTFLLRCRILDCFDGKPGKDLIYEDIVVESTIKRGEIKIDLKPYHIILDTPFFLVFEWIMNKSMADYYKLLDENRPEWWPEGTSIKNRNKIVYYDDHGKINKEIKLTKKQQEKLEQFRHKTTAFSIKKSKYKCFVRESSMAPWREFNETMVANINYLTK